MTPEERKRFTFDLMREFMGIIVLFAWLIAWAILTLAM